MTSLQIVTVQYILNYDFKEYYNNRELCGHNLGSVVVTLDKILQP